MLEGCKDVEGNLHKLGDSYIGQKLFQTSLFQSYIGQDKHIDHQNMETSVQILQHEKKYSQTPIQ